MKKIVIILFSILMGALLSGCEKQPLVPDLSVDEGLMKYVGMTYGTFLEEGGTEAQTDHASYFTAQIPGTGLTAVFSSGGYDADYNAADLENTDKMVRLQGKIGEICKGIAEELTLDEFAARLARNGDVPAYSMEEGGGTAYYIADHYAIIFLDSGEETEAPLRLEVALDASDPSEQIGPDTYAWLTWQ